MPTFPPSARDTAIRALRGEADAHAIHAILPYWQLMRLIALSNDASSGARALAALACSLPSLLTDADIGDPDVSNAMRGLIGVPEGALALAQWGNIAPVGWGAESADALLAAMHKKRCRPDTAAILIGPVDDVAASLESALDIAHAITCWGRSRPDHPAWWAAALSPKVRQHLISILQRAPFVLSMCIPWLPPDVMDGFILTDAMTENVLDSFVGASAAVCAAHADLLHQVIQRAREWEIGVLTRVAVRTPIDGAWDRICDLLQHHPDRADSVMSVASWKRTPCAVRNVILAHVDQSPICAAIAAARGQCDAPPHTHQTAAAFFAALDPDVWDAMDETQRDGWRRSLADDIIASLAIRALGVRPDILTVPTISDMLIQAARMHCRDDAALRQTLLPVALKEASLQVMSAAIAALPRLPPDPDLFLRIVVGAHTHPASSQTSSAHPDNPADLAVSALMQRIASIPPQHETYADILASALAGRTWRDIAPILDALPPDRRMWIAPEVDSLAGVFLPAYHGTDLHRVLMRIAAAPPDVALPTMRTLLAMSAVSVHEWKEQTIRWAADIADALRNHGDLFLTLRDELPNVVIRDALLPSPPHRSLSRAVRSLARHNPLTAHRLAHALQRSQADRVLTALLAAPPTIAESIWRALPTPQCTALKKEASSTLDIIAAEGQAHELRAIWNRLLMQAPMVALGLSLLGHADPEANTNGMHTIASTPESVRAIFTLLRPDIRARLLSHDAIRIAVADMPHHIGTRRHARLHRR